MTDARFNACSTQQKKAAKASAAECSSPVPNDFRFKGRCNFISARRDNAQSIVIDKAIGDQRGGGFFKIVLYSKGPGEKFLQCRFKPGADGCAGGIFIFHRFFYSGVGKGQRPEFFRCVTLELECLDCQDSVSAKRTGFFFIFSWVLG